MPWLVNRLPLRSPHSFFFQIVQYQMLDLEIRNHLSLYPKWDTNIAQDSDVRFDFHGNPMKV